MPFDGIVSNKSNDNNGGDVKLSSADVIHLEHEHGAHK
jgi:hypothetical protein